MMSPDVILKPQSKCGCGKQELSRIGVKEIPEHGICGLHGRLDFAGLLFAKPHHALPAWQSTIQCQVPTVSSSPAQFPKGVRKAVLQTFCEKMVCAKENERQSSDAPDDLQRHFLGRVGVRAPLARPPLRMRILPLAVRLHEVEHGQIEDKLSQSSHMASDLVLAQGMMHWCFICLAARVRAFNVNVHT